MSKADLTLIAVAVQAGKGFSPLFRWMRSHHDAFADLVEGARPNWTKLAEAFAQMGIAAPDGAPLHAETVRHTWWRARRDRQSAKPRREVSVKSVVVPAAATPPPAPLAPVSDPLAEIRRQMANGSGRKADG